jgi:hypothetical protein
VGEAYRFHLGTHVGIWTIRYESGRWDLLSEAVPGASIEAIVPCPSQPEWLLAGAAWNGAYLSRDSGLNWERVLEGDIRAFAYDPSDDRVVYAGTGPVQLYRSDDRGLSWKRLEALEQMRPEVQEKWGAPAALKGALPGHVRDIFVHPEDSNHIVVAIEHGGVVQTLDAGKSWEDISEGIAYVDMHVVKGDPRRRDRFYVSSARGFFRTDDVGEGWIRIEDGMPYAYTERQCYSHGFLFLDGDPRRLLVAGANGSPGFWGRPTRAEGTMLVSDDDGENWHESNAGFPTPMRWMAADLFPHPSDPNIVFAGMGDEPRGFGLAPGTRGSGAIYLTKDRGDSWEPLIPDLPSIDSLHVAVE